MEGKELRVKKKLFISPCFLFSFYIFRCFILVEREEKRGGGGEEWGEWGG